MADKTQIGKRKLVMAQALFHGQRWKDCKKSLLRIKWSSGVASTDGSL